MKKLLFLFLFCGVSLCFANGFVNLLGDDSTKELQEIADQQYNRVCKLLNLEEGKVINIKIYPSIEELHQDLNLADSDWIIGGYCDDYIGLVSHLNPGSCHSGESVIRALHADIAGVLLAEFCQGTAPEWMLNGYSYYQPTELPEGAYSKSMLNGTVKNLAKDPLNFSLANLNNESMSDSYYKEPDPKKWIMEERERSSLGYSLLAYIINTYGYEKLAIFAQTDSVKEAFNLSLEEFEDGWFNYAKAMTY